MIRSGPIPTDEALRIARQIAEAIESAHESGVIHRDLEPANVKLTEEGDVKVPDFGLPPGSNPAAAPNIKGLELQEFQALFAWRKNLFPLSSPRTATSPVRAYASEAMSMTKRYFTSPFSIRS